MVYSKKTVLSPKNASLLGALYTISAEDSAARIAALLNLHCAGVKQDVKVFSSPGRIEIVGNHTDHNNGKVVAAAVSVDTIAAVTPLAENKVIVDSAGYPIVEVSLDDLTPVVGEQGTSNALIRGVAEGFVSRGYKIGGFRATTTSNVSKGAGVSSSASFEVLAAEIFNVLYNDGKVTAVEKAIISQYAENVHFGKPSGLMDQSAISLGGVSYIDFADTAKPVVEKLSWDFDGFSVVIVNCGGDHCNLTPHYAAIRAEMEEVARLMGKEKLRFVQQSDFTAAIPVLKKKTSGRAILRAMHYFEENERVEAFRSALKARDEDGILRAVNESGISSYTKLQNCYAEGDPSQNIPLALALARAQAGVRALRVHGGGFAGTILAFVENAAAASYSAFMSKVFRAENVFILKIRDSGAVEIPLP